jgi:hypothetical protein
MANSVHAKDAKSESGKAGKSSDTVSRIIAIAAFVLSAITFALQFVAHDEVSYSLSHVTISKAPTDYYFAVSLSIFNGGNRSAALVEAAARFLKRTLTNKATITDSDCPPSRQVNSEEFVGLNTMASDKDSPNPFLPSLYQYEAVIEPGKLFTKTLIFSIGKAIHPSNWRFTEGAVCLVL